MPVISGNATLVVALAVGLITLLVGLRWPFLMLAVLVLGVPLRDFMSRWLNVHSNLSLDQVTAIGRWWFVVIAVLLLLEGLWALLRFVRDRGSRRLTWMDFALAGALVSALVATVLSPARDAAITSLRGYLQPLAVFFLARWIKPGPRMLRAFVATWLALGVAMAGFGVWQGLTWTEAQYRAEGYVRQNGDLVVPHATIRGEPYLRPASTVSGPNELGLDMAVLFFLAGHLFVQFPDRRRIVFAALALLFTAGLALTVSRSALLAYGLGAVASLLLLRGRLWAAVGSGWARRIRLALFTAVVVAAALLILNAAGFLALLGSTLGKLGSTYHIVDTREAILYLARHPQGVGMGLVEPKGALTLLDAESLYHVEGSLLQIGMEMGVWGLAFWLWFLWLALRRVARLMKSVTDGTLNALMGAAYAAWVGSLAAFVFLPLMQSISLMVWLWFLLGLAVQSGDVEASWSGGLISTRLWSVPPRPTESQDEEPGRGASGRLLRPSVAGKEKGGLQAALPPANPLNSTSMALRQKSADAPAAQGRREKPQGGGSAQAPRVGLAG